MAFITVLQITIPEQSSHRPTHTAHFFNEIAIRTANVSVSAGYGNESVSRMSYG